MSGAWETVIGLEVHCELSTESKLFCGCKNAFGAPPNTLCCPVCTGMPGALPVLNRRAVEYAVKAGLALGCTINPVSRMARKHYFYPDLPKAYQISQHDLPLCEKGCLEYMEGGRVKRLGITRVHIEEDAGKLSHSEASLADYNRCGVPLIEIVTEPDLRGADEAKAALEGIARILAHLGVSDAKMQEGSLRADLNVSLRPVGQQGYGPRVELKNLNSFSALRRAVLHEEARQRAIVGAGGDVERETRRWNDARGQSSLLRGKEDAGDYLYFPEPDLPSLAVDAETVEHLRAELPELPLHRTLRFQREYALSEYEARLLCAQRPRADFFEATVAAGAAPKAAANWLLGEVARLLGERGASLNETALRPQSLAELLALIEAGDISGTAGKELLAALMGRDAPARELAEELGLAQISGQAALAALVAGVLAANPKAAGDYRAGKSAALGFLLGQCMKQSHGRGNPGLLRRMLEEALGQPIEK